MGLSNKSVNSSSFDLLDDDKFFAPILKQNWEPKPQPLIQTVENVESFKKEIEPTANMS